MLRGLLFSATSIEDFTASACNRDLPTPGALLIYSPQGNFSRSLSIYFSGFGKFRRSGLSGCISEASSRSTQDVPAPCNFLGSRWLSPVGSGIKIPRWGGVGSRLLVDDVNLPPGIFVSARGNPRQGSPLSVPRGYVCACWSRSNTLRPVDRVRKGAWGKKFLNRASRRVAGATINDARARFLCKGICKSNLRPAFSNGVKSCPSFHFSFFLLAGIVAWFLEIAGNVRCR